MTSFTPRPQPVSLDDVLSVLADTDPHATNAAAVRAGIGRGSYATIQKHLDAIRAERRAAAVVPGDASTAPAAPADAINAIWTTAYAAAALKVANRMEVLSAERDAAMIACDALTGDVTGLTNALDTAEAAADAAIAELEEEKQLAAAAIDAMRESHDAIDSDYLEDQQRAAAEAAAAAKEREKLEHELALAKRDIDVVREAQQRTIDNLTAQVAELKYLLAQLKPNSQA